MTRTDEEVDEMANNILATGAMHAIIGLGARAAAGGCTVDLITTTEGIATNQLEVEFDFLKSPYRITVERIAEGEST